MTSQVLRSVYEYESNDNKVLNFKIGERFIIIKASKPNDWVYCVNSLGQLGYVPHDYVTYEQVQHHFILHFNQLFIYSFLFQSFIYLLFCFSMNSELKKTNCCH
jgi:hypothetical protein